MIFFHHNVIYLKFSGEFNPAEELTENNRTDK